MFTFTLNDLEIHKIVINTKKYQKQLQVPLKKLQ